MQFISKRVFCFALVLLRYFPTESENSKRLITTRAIPCPFIFDQSPAFIADSFGITSQPLPYIHRLAYYYSARLWVFSIPSPWRTCLNLSPFSIPTAHMSFLALLLPAELEHGPHRVNILWWKRMNPTAGSAHRGITRSLVQRGSRWPSLVFGRDGGRQGRGKAAGAHTGRLWREEAEA